MFHFYKQRCTYFHFFGRETIGVFSRVFVGSLELSLIVVKDSLSTVRCDTARTTGAVLVITDPR